MTWISGQNPQIA